MLINYHAQRPFSPPFFGLPTLSPSAFSLENVISASYQDIPVQLEVKLLQKHNGIYRMEDWKKDLDSLSRNRLGTDGMQPD
jgi:hypothetical protein